MRANSATRFSFVAIWIASTLLPLGGCGKETEPTYTSPDAIDQYLQEHPEEAYSSDSISEDMTEAEDSDDG